MSKQYGEFSPKGDEFIINQAATPKPWTQIFTNGSVVASISHRGEGSLVELRSGQTHPITRPESDDLLPHYPSRQLILRDNDSGEIWHLTGASQNQASEHFEAIHSQSDTRIRKNRHEIDSAVSFFVPREDPCEIWHVTLRNTSTSKRRISLFAAVEWATENGTAFELSFSDSTIIGQQRTGETSKRLSFFACDRAIDSFDTRLDAFHGLASGTQVSSAVRDGRCSRSLGPSPRPIGALQKNLTLGSGAETELTFLVGAVWGAGSTTAQVRTSGQRAIKRLVQSYRENQAVTTAYTQVKKQNEEQLNRNLTKTPDPFFDAFTNFWSKHEALTAAESATAPTAAALSGFAAIAANEPLLARKLLLRFFAEQSHSGQLLEKNGQDLSQHLVAATVAYLRESGDLSLLGDHVDYVDSTSASILHHLTRALDYGANHLSRRHLPITERAANIDRGEDTEDIVTACTTYQNLREIIPILDSVGEHELVRRYDRHASLLKEAINDHFWDGSWYGNRLIEGKKAIGFKKNDHHSCNLSSQTAAIVSGVARADRAKKILGTFRAPLFSKYGLVSFSPAYPHPTADERSIPAAGTGANGAIIPAQNCSAIQAASVAGDGDEAYRLWQLTCPAYLSLKPDQYQAEPFRHAAYIYGPDHPLFGRGVVGQNEAGALMWQAAFQTILGIQPTLGGLKIDPCLPRDWRQVEVTRQFRGAEYHIRILNSFRQNKGVDRILVDGLRITGTVIPPHASGIHFVEVVIG